MATDFKISNHAIAIVCCLAVALISCISLLHEGSVFGANDSSRWDTVWSLNNGKGYIIDAAPYPTIDKVYREGHFYSSKPALLPTVVAGVTYVISKATRFYLPRSDYVLTRMVLMIVNLAPFTLTVVLYAGWLREQGCSNFAKSFCLWTAAFGTYLTAYSITLNNHTVAAFGVFMSILELQRIANNQPHINAAYFFCGVFSAWTVCTELISFPLLFWLVGWLLKSSRDRTLLLFLPGALVVIFVSLVCTVAAGGNPIPIYLRHQLYQYPGSYWEHPMGIDAANESKAVYIANHLVGHHGILSLTPVFIFSFIGMACGPTAKPLRVMGCSLTLLNLFFVILGTKNYGGVCQGARWFMWLIPIWLFLLPQAVDTITRSLLGKLFSICTLAISIFSVLYAMIAHPAGPWSTSWMQDWMYRMEWISY